MIEQGLVQLVQGTPAVSAIATGGGGFFAGLPKDLTLASWSYKFISVIPELTLNSVGALARGRIQIDCYGTGGQAIRLAAAINTVLNGFHGTLTDPDSTHVQLCFQDGAIDFEDDAGRTYRRMLEYQLWFGS
jgi:uncharacterized protein DUF3168